MLTIIATILENVKLSLGLMVQGMLGIFIFMVIFYLLIYALEHFVKPKEK